MRFVKQQSTLPVKNIDIGNVHSQEKRHSVLLPNTIRSIIVGPSNCGKTNVMISLLAHSNGLKFENIYIYSKSLQQPKYIYLEKLIKSIKGIGYYTFTENVDVVAPSDAKKNSIMIFDDVACSKQDNIRSYFSMGRHNNVDSFYLGQTYSKIPKQLIRDNANFIIIFKQDDTNLRHIYNDHVNTDMNFDMFQGICCKCWKTHYGFIVIDKDSCINNGRYRNGLDEFVVI